MFEKCLDLGKQLGLKGKDLLEFAEELEEKMMEEEIIEEMRVEREKVREHE